MKNTFIKWLGKLLSASNEASVRRFIAILLVPPYITGILIGFLIAYKGTNYTFFLTALIAAALPILIAFFVLTWQDIATLTKNLDKFVKIDTEEEKNEEIVEPLDPNQI